MENQKQTNQEESTQISPNADKTELANQLVDELDEAVPGNAAIKHMIICDAIEACNVAGDRQAVKPRLTQLFVGPRGCGVSEMIQKVWSRMGRATVVIDAINFRQKSLINEDDMLHRLLSASEFDVKKAGRGVVVIENLERICKRDEEYRKIQEELELLIRGMIVSVGGNQKKNSVYIDTSLINFFATTSGFHDEKRAVVYEDGDGATKCDGEHERIAVELVMRGMLPELITAFDEIRKFNSINVDELLGYLAIDKDGGPWSDLSKLGVKIEAASVQMIVDLVLQRGGGLRTLRSILNLIQIRCGFTNTDQDEAIVISPEWLKYHL